ncbi:MAG: ABC transporter permease subunit [Victivallales bacterium]|nr:ABC transporter permease subunit [Victivallales bacterium]MCF7888562.1 ABC transporter permease subunit [Victivallales bacterium]
MKYSTIAVFVLTFFIIAVIAVGCFSITIDSAVAIFRDKNFLTAVLFSLETSICAVILAIIIGVPAGLYLSKRNNYMVYIIDSVLDIPIVVPPLIVGVLMLNFLNIAALRSIYNFIFTFWGAVIAQFFVSIPLTVKSARNSFAMVPPVYEMIAITLGKKPFKAFWDTTLKIALPGISSGLILTWMRCLGEFGATLMVGGGIPGKTENIPVNIYINITSGNYEKGLSASIITIIIAFTCILFMRILYFFRKNEK